MIVQTHTLMPLLTASVTGILLACAAFGKKKGRKGKHTRPTSHHKGVTQSKPQSRHSKNIAKATLLMSKIASIPSDGAKINYLRKIDPYVFEELLLTAYERQGYTAIRNEAYSGDGGLDGKVISPDGDTYLIQAKRYGGHIRRSHVVDFAKLCSQHQCKGLFIHTGKSSVSIRQFARKKQIKVVSGSQLIKLLIEEKC